jgi:hypothetical protein
MAAGQYIAAVTVAAAAAFALWRAPRRAIRTTEHEGAFDPRVVQSMERG